MYLIYFNHCSFICCCIWLTGLYIIKQQ